VIDRGPHQRWSIYSAQLSIVAASLIL
jgi:hypothetical protein